jgi:hypothetical protein
MKQQFIFDETISVEGLKKLVVVVVIVVVVVVVVVVAAAAAAAAVFCSILTKIITCRCTSHVHLLRLIQSRQLAL